MRFRIVQCLCPKRHAILALAMPTTDVSDAEALDLMKAAVKAMLDGNGAELGLPPSNPWCGLCGAPSSEWKAEIGWTREFPSWDAALQTLKKSEADQRATSAILTLLDATFDARTYNAMARNVNDIDKSTEN